MMASPRLEEFRRHLIPRLTRGVLGATHATERTTLPRTGIHRILICRTVHTLGDSLMLTPLLDELANIYPGAEMDIISGYPFAAALYAFHPNVRCVFCLPAHVPGHPLGTLRVLHSTRRKRYDLAIDPDPRSQSGRLLTLYARATRKLGYLGPNKGGVLSHGVDVSNAPSHRAMEGVYLLRTALGEDAMLRNYPQPSLWLTVEERERGRQRLAHVCGVHNAADPLPRIGESSRMPHETSHWASIGGGSFLPPSSHAHHSTARSRSFRPSDVPCWKIATLVSTAATCANSRPCSQTCPSTSALIVV